MAKQPETTREWIERYEQREQKAYRDYQETGEARYDRQQYEYGKIADAFRALDEIEQERDREIKKRMDNKSYVVSRLVKEKYTKDEVAKLLDEAVWL